MEHCDLTAAMQGIEEGTSPQPSTGPIAKGKRWSEQQRKTCLDGVMFGYGYLLRTVLWSLQPASIIPSIAFPLFKHVGTLCHHRVYHKFISISGVFYLWLSMYICGIPTVLLPWTMFYPVASRRSVRHVSERSIGWPGDGDLRTWTN